MFLKPAITLIQISSRKANMAETKTKLVARAVGRRKRAVATVRLSTGTGDITVNGKPAGDYFPGATAKVKLNQPFVLCATSKYSATVRVSGGGTNGQIDAVVLGISRALSGVKKDFRTVLKPAGLLTRDSRERQRRMIGMGGKSRRRKQSPKR